MWRVGWGVGDQALSSLTNFALGILVARSVSTEALGAFALAFATYTVFLNIARSVGTQPLLVRFSGPPDAAWRGATASATALAIATGVVGGIGCAVIALVGEGALRAAFAALALTLPGLLLQDAWRFSFFAAGRGKAAFANDLVWAVVMMPAVIAISGIGGGIFALVMAWGAAATVGGVYGLAQSGVRPDHRGISAWWAHQRDLAIPFTAESMTSVVSSQAVLYALGLIVDLAAVGALRAGQLLLGPLNILLQGVQLVALPEAVGAAAQGPGRLVRVVRTVAVAQFALVGAFGAVVLVMPDAVGSAILGASWAVAQPVLPPLIVGYLGIAGTFACHIGLRALAAARRSLRATIITAVLTLTLGILGATAAGAVGAAWGLAIAALLGLVVWTTELLAGLSDHAGSVRERTED